MPRRRAVAPGHAIGGAELVGAVYWSGHLSSEVPSGKGGPSVEGQQHSGGRVDPVLKRVRRVAIAVIGGTVLLIGGAMIILPGPAVIVIPVGLAILATEFVWARRLLERIRARLRR